MKSMASNSVMTRARAKYGECLGKADFEALASLSTLAEAVSYLRSRTHFAPYFEKLASDPALTRMKLETAIRYAFVTETQRLCGFEKSVGNTIFSCFVIGSEAELLLDYIINLSHGTPEKMIFRIPSRYSGYSGIDFASLFQINDVAKLPAFLKKTKFAKLSAVLPKSNDGEFDISLIETTIERIRYGLVFGIINKAFPSETAKTISRGILMRIELADFCLIYRAKKYYGLSENYIRTNLVGYRCLLSQKVSESILASPTADDALDILKNSVYSSKIKRYGIDDIELFCKKAAIDSDIKQIHFSADPAVVLSAYLRIFEAECENVIKTIEGIAYRIPKEEIIRDLIVIKKGA